MESKKKISRNDLVRLNNAWKDVKVKGLTADLTKEYLYLKVKLTDLATQTQKSAEEAHKTLLTEFGIKEGESIPKEKEFDIVKKVNDVLSKIGEEEVELNTHILPMESLSNCILSISENDNLTTENKSIVMKFLASDL